MDMKTPFKTVTGLGSARSGTGHFWQQRLTALANVPLTLFLVWLIVKLQGSDATAVKALFSNPLVAGLGVLAFLSMGWHMKLGLQVVIEDYVHNEGLKILALVANIFFALLVAALGAVFVIKLGL